MFAYISSLPIMPSWHERRRRNWPCSILQYPSPSMIDGKQDLGRILETMLYYDRVHLVASAQTFTGPWDLLGPDGLCAIFEYPSVTVILTPPMLGEE